MYPSVHLSPPLPPAAFYILLALSHGDMHGYAIRAAITNDSLGSVKVNGGYLYPLLTKMCGQQLILCTDPQESFTGRQLVHYRITQHGLICLKEELKRLRHAVKIGEAAGHFIDTLPPDIQRLLADLR